MRKGFDRLAVLLQQVLEEHPHCGAKHTPGKAWILIRQIGARRQLRSLMSYVI
jgi:hypothetical protein